MTEFDLIYKMYSEGLITLDELRALVNDYFKSGTKASILKKDSTRSPLESPRNHNT